MIDFIETRDSGHEMYVTAILLVLTFVSGFVDAISYLALGKVFVSNMTGNVLLLGFGIAHAPGVSAGRAAAAVVAFAFGALLCGQIAKRTSSVSGLMLGALLPEVLLLTLAGGAYAFAEDVKNQSSQLVIASILALAMGIQTTIARKLSNGDVPTTVVTSLLAGLAAGGLTGHEGGIGRRVGSLASMLAGAAAGALLVTR